MDAEEVELYGQQPLICQNALRRCRLSTGESTSVCLSICLSVNITGVPHHSISGSCFWFSFYLLLLLCSCCWWCWWSAIVCVTLWTESLGWRFEPVIKGEPFECLPGGKGGGYAELEPSPAWENGEGERNQLVSKKFKDLVVEVKVQFPFYRMMDHPNFAHTHPVWLFDLRLLYYRFIVYALLWGDEWLGKNIRDKKKNCSARHENRIQFIP